MKERKGSISRLALHELENESVDEESASPEIVDEDNSPTASSTSRGSSGHDNNLAEPLEMEIIDQAAHVEASDENLSLEVNLVVKPKVVSPLQLHKKEPVPGELSGFIIPVAHISSSFSISISLPSVSFSLIHEVVYVEARRASNNYCLRDAIVACTSTESSAVCLLIPSKFIR